MHLDAYTYISKCLHVCVYIWVNPYTITPLAIIKVSRALHNRMLLVIKYRTNVGARQNDPPHPKYGNVHIQRKTIGVHHFSRFDNKQGQRRTLENDRVQIAIAHRKTIGVRRFSLLN